MKYNDLAFNKPAIQILQHQETTMDSASKLSHQKIRFFPIDVPLAVTSFASLVEVRGV